MLTLYKAQAAAKRAEEDRDSAAAHLAHLQQAIHDYDAAVTTIQRTAEDLETLHSGCASVHYFCPGTYTLVFVGPF